MSEYTTNPTFAGMRGNPYFDETAGAARPDDETTIEWNTAALLALAYEQRTANLLRFYGNIPATVSVDSGLRGRLGLGES